MFQLLTSALNDLAPFNAPAMFATQATFHLLMSAVNLTAALNMFAMCETQATFHLLMSALNDDVEAVLNVLAMFETEATFHLLMSALKTVVVVNMPAMSDTDATFHLLMSALNVGLPATFYAMLLTRLTSQSAILPYVVVAVLGVVTQSDTAVAMLASVIGVSASAVGLSVVGLSVAELVSTAARIDMAALHVCGSSRMHCACTDAPKTRSIGVARSVLPLNSTAPSTSLYEVQSALCCTLYDVTHSLPVAQPCVTTPTTVCTVPRSIVMYSPTCDMLADHDWAELIIDCADPVPAALLPKTLEYDRALSAGLRNVHCAAALHDAMDTHVGYTERRVAPHPSPQNALIAALLQSESAVLLVKELVRSTTLTTFHLAKFWFSAAVMNILRMFATDAVFHAPMLTLNAFAEPNIWTMFDTDAVFHVPISWLNADVI